MYKVGLIWFLIGVGEGVVLALWYTDNKQLKELVKSGKRTRAKI